MKKILVISDIESHQEIEKKINQDQYSIMGTNNIDNARLFFDSVSVDYVIIDSRIHYLHMDDFCSFLTNQTKVRFSILPIKDSINRINQILENKFSFLKIA